MLTFMFHLVSTEIINRCIKIISGLNSVKIKTMILWKTLDVLLFNRWAWKTSVKGNIRIDDEKGMYLSTKHLIENGHTNIGFVGARSYSLVDKTRYKGYVKALKENNIEVDENNVFECFATFDDGYNIADKILANKNITGVVCSADIIAIAVVKRFKELGKEIPRDLSIVGFDDIQDAKYIFPGVTTIRQDIGKKGNNAAKIIIDCLENESNVNKVITLEPRLIKRESVKNIKT